jgi:hypothetical protein
MLKIPFGTSLASITLIMSISIYWLPMLLAHSASAGAPQPAAVAPDPVADAAPQWAAAVTQRADAGWHLRDLSSSHDADAIRLSITLASSGRAERMSVQYDLASASFSEFAREKVALPTEERHYDNEQVLFEELSLSAPRAVNIDCADFYLDFGSRSVSFAEDDFVVSLWSTGRRPGARLSTWLVASLKDGQLVDIRDERSDDGAEVRSEVVLVVDSAEGVEEMRVELGPDGAPTYLRLQHTPGNTQWAPHPDGETPRQLAAGAAIEGLRFSGEDFDHAPELQIDLAQDAQVTLDLGAFEAGEDECGC